jgi:hypothetical protein
MQTNTTKEIVFSLRIPLDLNKKILAEAGKEKRSRHSQIIYALEKAFETEETKKEKRAVN